MPFTPLSDHHFSTADCQLYNETPEIKSFKTGTWILFITIFAMCTPCIHNAKINLFRAVRVVTIYHFLKELHLKKLDKSILKRKQLNEYLKGKQLNEYLP